MSEVEASDTSPLTITDGTLAAQVELVFYTPLIQRIQVALCATAEYIIKIESSGDTNYADLALFARMVALNPAYYAQQLAWLIVNDSTITATCTDQALMNRIWTVWPVASYKCSTILFPTTGA